MNKLTSHLSKKFFKLLFALGFPLFAYLETSIVSAQSQAVIAQGERTSKAPTEVKWLEQAPGLHLGSSLISNPISSFKSELILLKINLNLFSLKVADSRQDGPSLNTVKALTQKRKAIAGINANFYGRNDKPLGLVISEGKRLNRLHRSGSVLTGVFFLKDGRPNIVHRDDYGEIVSTLALQSGPRIISESEPLSFKKSNGATRRSGIAITAKNEIILYATKSRFPGARLEEIQDVFSMPSLEVTDVLNFDGGGSSQFYFNKKALGSSVSKKTSPRKTTSSSKSLLSNNPTEINISGGDPVPIALIITRR